MALTSRSWGLLDRVSSHHKMLKTLVPSYRASKWYSELTRNSCPQWMPTTLKISHQANLRIQTATVWWWMPLQAVKISSSRMARRVVMLTHSTKPAHLATCLRPLNISKKASTSSSRSLTFWRRTASKLPRMPLIRWMCRYPRLRTRSWDSWSRRS